MPAQFELGFLAGLLVGEGHFGGDGRQPQVALRMHVRHEAIFQWLERTFPGGRLYGPYNHDGRHYFQWMARGRYLRDELVPLLDQILSPSLDRHSFERYQLMKTRYPQLSGQPGDKPVSGRSFPTTRTSDQHATASSSAKPAGDPASLDELLAQIRESWPSLAIPWPPVLLLRMLLPRHVGTHRLHDPLQVIDRRELDHDLPLTLTKFYLDPRLEQVGETVG